MNSHAWSQSDADRPQNSNTMARMSSFGRLLAAWTVLAALALQPARLACPAPALPPKPAPVLSCQQFLDAASKEEDGSGPGSLARKMCRKHQEKLCSLPMKHKGSAGCGAAGWPADILEFPHMALLGYGDRDDIEFACGGSLISPDFILTAAHCARSDGQSVRWVLLGATNRTSQQPKGNDTHQLLEVSETILHPEFTDGLKYHDIALLRLAKPARVSQENVRPACLDTDVDADNTGQDAVATGWGATSFDGEGSRHLIKTNLTVRELHFCKKGIKLDATKLPRGLEGTQLCAGGGDHGRDTCQGDSGGPLQMRANPSNSVTCLYRIIGIVSFGPLCGLGKPGVYTRVAAYVDWIESIVWPTNSDGCSRRHASDPEAAGEVLFPNTGPGTVARGVCRSYHVEFCQVYHASETIVKPDLSVDSKCHQNKAQVDWKKKTLPTTVTFRWGSSQHNLQYSCAGALVSPRAVLTAGRCASLGCLQITTVILGNPKPCSATPFSREAYMAVESVLVHPEYRPGQSYADLAVVFLKKAVDLRLFIPLCLDTPGRTKLQAGRRAMAAAWYTTGEWENLDYSLGNDTLVVHTQAQCEAALMGNKKVRSTLPRGYQPSLLCAGGLCTNETYAGDSGTPLTVRAHTLDTLSGLYHVDYVAGLSTSASHCTARGANGNQLPDLFTSVAKHVGWIESVVWPDQ